MERSVHIGTQNAEVTWAVVQRVLVDVVHVLSVALGHAPLGGELTASGVATGTAFFLIGLGVKVLVFFFVVSHICGT